MKRLLFNLAAAGSLALCLTTAGLWVRSYWKYDVVESFWPTGQFTAQGYAVARGIEVISIRGRLVISWIGNTLASGEPQSLLDRRVIADRDGTEFLRLYPPISKLGIIDRSPQMLRIGLSDASVVALTMILPAARLLSLRRRRIPGLCPTCGYDLRATPDRCPECGNAPGEPRRMGLAPPLPNAPRDAQVR